MLVVVTKGVKKNLDVILAAIAALEVRRMVYLPVRIQFHHFVMYVHKEFICSYWLMLVYYGGV